MKIIMALLLCASFAYAQQVNKPYEIPFASKGNIIELAVANTTTIVENGIKVDLVNPPVWLNFSEKSVSITNLKAKEEQIASFSFSVDKRAEINKEQTLTFNITDKTGRMWTKEIKIKIAQPTNYVLFQNYPNPFNPSTKIEYQLPAAGKVSLKIYDILGREVANLINEQQDAGYHQTTFDAHRLSSGTYIYRIIALDEQHNRHVFQKKMLMLK